MDTLTFKLNPAVYFIEQTSFFPDVEIVVFKVDQFVIEYLRQNCAHLTKGVVQFVVSPTPFNPNASISDPVYEVEVRIDCTSDEVKKEASHFRSKYGL
jgi:hypothetical protein